MGKKQFYIYQEDLIKYKESQVPVNLSKFVKDLNIKFCEEDMKKLRTEKITTFLVERGYLLEGEERYRRPTTKGKLLGIFTDNILDKTGQERLVNFYTSKAQRYILDNMYEIL